MIASPPTLNDSLIVAVSPILKCLSMVVLPETFKVSDKPVEPTTAKSPVIVEFPPTLKVFPKSVAPPTLKVVFNTVSLPTLNLFSK